MTPLASLPDHDFERLLRQAVALPEAPPALVQRAIALWATRPAPVASLLRRIAAVLAFDSWAQPAAAAGVRAPRSATRHLLYSADGRDIDLRVTPVADAFTLAGQVLGPDEAGNIELTADGASARHATLDALGEFRIEGLPQGEYRMTLRMGGDEIVLPAVPIGTPSM